MWVRRLSPSKDCFDVFWRELGRQVNQLTSLNQVRRGAAYTDLHVVGLYETLVPLDLTAANVVEWYHIK